MNTDKEPSIPHRFTLVHNQRYGLVHWSADKTDLFQDMVQQLGHDDAITVRILGSRLFERVKRKRVMNATMHDYLLQNPHLIPASWKKKKAGVFIRVYFWGSLFRDRQGVLWVNFLIWDKPACAWDCGMTKLAEFHGSDSYAAVLK